MKITRYPIVFGSPSVDLGFIETINPAAVDRTLRGGDDVVALRNHDSSFPLARRSAGTLALSKETRGLLVVADVDEAVSYVADLVRIIERGDAKGSSFAFRAFDDVWSLVDGVPHREVLDMSVREVSFGVAFPAYPATAIRSERSIPRTRSVAFARAELKQWMR